MKPFIAKWAYVFWVILSTIVDQRWQDSFLSFSKFYSESTHAWYVTVNWFWEKKTISHLFQWSDKTHTNFMNDISSIWIHNAISLKWMSLVTVKNWKKFIMFINIIMFKKNVVYFEFRLSHNRHWKCYQIISNTKYFIE